MLASYHLWVYENHRIECVEVVREWVIQEAEFQVKALEMAQAISYSKPWGKSYQASSIKNFLWKIKLQSRDAKCSAD